MKVIKRWRLHWRNNYTEVIEGENFGQAFRKAGYDRDLDLPLCRWWEPIEDEKKDENKGELNHA
jgi:hypothetical protein